MFNNLKYCFKIINKHSKFIFITIFITQVFSILIAINNLYLPKMIIDELTTDKDKMTILILVSVFLGINFFANIINNYLNTYKEKVDYKSGRYFRLDLMQKMNRVDMQDLESKELNELDHSVREIADRLGFCNQVQSVFQLFGNIALLIIIINIAFSLNIIIIGVILCLAIFDLIYSDRNAKKSTERWANVYKHSGAQWYLGQLVNTAKYAKEIRTFNNNKEFIIDTQKEVQRKHKDAVDKAVILEDRKKYFDSVLTFIRDIIGYIIFILLYLRGELTIGEFTMGISAIAIFSGKLKNIYSLIVDFSKNKPYFDVLSKFLNINENIFSTGKDNIDFNQLYTIELKNVFFKYPTNEEYTLKKLNLKIEKGKKYALVGENGSGKTTLTKIITRLYEAEGDILINGKSIKDYDFNQYIDLFSVVFQDFKLFSFSMAENVAFDKYNENNKEQIKEILLQTGLKNKIDELKSGIDTNLNKDFDEEGFTPSGGESQKIALARAIFKNTQFIILDEPTSALDPRAEFEMYQKFDELTVGKTVIYISHRLSSCRFCDEIIVLKNGSIEEMGTHDNLMQNKGLYKELYDMQSEFYKSEVV